MPVTYKLTYLNGLGKGEVIRLIFALAGVEYEDVRIEWKDLDAYKPKTPNGQVPVLEIDGKQFCQSLAICRYLAEKYGFHGKTPQDKLRVDMIVDTVWDLIQSVFHLARMSDEEKASAAKKKFEEGELTESLKNLEKMLVANKGGDGYFVGDGLTWADLMVFQWVMWPTIELAGIKVNRSKVPKLQALYERVEKEPQIAAWLEKRPKTPY